MFFYPPPGMEDAWLAVGFADPGAGVDELGRPHAGDADLIVGERFVSAEDAGEEEEAFVPQFDTEYTITSAFALAGGGPPIPKTDAMSPGTFGGSGKACAYAQMTDSSGLYYMFVERPLVYANNAGGAGGMAVDLAKGQPYHLVWAVYRPHARRRRRPRAHGPLGLLDDPDVRAPAGGPRRHRDLHLRRHARRGAGHEPGPVFRRRAR